MKEAKEFRNATDNLILAFCKKQELEFQGWAENGIFQVALLSNNYFYNIHDMVLDLESESKSGEITSYIQDEVKFLTENPEERSYSYFEYLKGKRRD